MAKLSKEAIVSAAFELLADGGEDALTARALAERLGVRAGALYYHVPDMSGLRDEMATVIMRELIRGEPEAEGSWRDFLRGEAQYVRSVLLRYRDGAKLFAGTRLTDDSTLTSMEVPLRVLTTAGFAVDDALRAQHTLFNFTIGFVIEEQHRYSRKDEYTEQRRRARLDERSTPLTVQANEAFLAEAEISFAWSVDTIISGLEARLG